MLSAWTEEGATDDHGRRAGNMRSYASDTALPGGKYEDGDEDDEGTAVSIAVHLPLIVYLFADRTVYG